MRRLTLAVLVAGLVLISPASYATGLVLTRSSHSVGDTMDRLETILRTKGLKVFARIDHAAAAKEVGVDLRPTQLLLFGNPRLGSQLFTSNQLAGIDLPMKALAWEDAEGRIWLAYNDPAYIASRHGIDDRPDIVAKMSDALKKLTAKAIQP